MEARSWLRWLQGLWFALKTLAIRGRFLTGRASFVKATLRAADHKVTEIFDENGKSLGQRLLSHYKVDTDRPQTGSQGWRLFAERVAVPGSHKPVALECGYCAHLFVIHVHPVANVEGDPMMGGESGLGIPVSYASHWFNYSHERYRGQPFLSCSHCEQKSQPLVKFLV